MAGKRIILEMGMGNDLHGGDYTKAALRAVQDALHHSSLTFIRTLGLDSQQMQVSVTIGVQQPDKVDAAQGRRLAAARPGDGVGGQGRPRRPRPRSRRHRGHRQRRDRGAVREPAAGEGVHKEREHPSPHFLREACGRDARAPR